MSFSADAGHTKEVYTHFRNAQALFKWAEELLNSESGGKGPDLLVACMCAV